MSYLSISSKNISATFAALKRQFLRFAKKTKLFYTTILLIIATIFIFFLPPVKVNFYYQSNPHAPNLGNTTISLIKPAQIRACQATLRQKPFILTPTNKLQKLAAMCFAPIPVRITVVKKFFTLDVSLAEPKYLACTKILPTPIPVLENLSTQAQQESKKTPPTKSPSYRIFVLAENGQLLPTPLTTCPQDLVYLEGRPHILKLYSKTASSTIKLWEQYKQYNKTPYVVLGKIRIQASKWEPPGLFLTLKTSNPKDKKRITIILPLHGDYNKLIYKSIFVLNKLTEKSIKFNTIDLRFDRTVIK